MPDKPHPDDIPTFEDVQEALGLDAMSYMSEMLRPDQHEEREDDANLPTAQTSGQELTPEDLLARFLLGEVTGN